MKKLIKKGFYPVILSAVLSATLVGCGDKEEITTEVNVPEDTELSISEEEYIKNELSKMVEKTYTEYRQFYDALSISKEEVAIMVNVLNGYYDGYSQDQIDDALANINRILLSDNVKQLLDNCNTRKYEGEAPITVSSDIVDEMKVLPNPLLQELSLNSEDLDIIITYENLRNELVNEIISSGTYSDSIVQKIRKAVIEQEYKGYISEAYTAVAAQWQLCNLCQWVNPTTSVITDSFGKEYQLSSKGYVNEEGYIESDEEAKYWALKLNNEDIPEEILSRLKNVIFIKYDYKLIELEKSIKSNASLYAAETNEVSDEENNEITQSTYNKYKNYYDSISVSEQDISIMVDVINGDVSNYSKDEIDSAMELANEILFPKKLQSSIKDCNDNKKVTYTKEDANIPSLSDMLIIHEYKANLESYESLRNEIAMQIANNGTYNASMVQKINNAVIDQETRKFDEYVDYLESVVNNEGPMSILMAADLQQCKLCVSVNPNVSFIKGVNDDYEYQISPRKDKNERGYIEQKVVDEYNELKKAGKEIPDDILEEYAIIQMELVPAKYEQQYNEWKNLLLIKAGYTDVSILDFYKQKKVLLSLLKERLFYNEIENDLSENSVFKGYALTFEA